VAVLRNSEKTPLFSIGERRNLLEELTSGSKTSAWMYFDGLHRAATHPSKRPSAMLRGIRALSDYEY